MTLSEMVGAFVANPFDPNKDGKTDVIELALVVGVITVFSFGWARIINSLVE